MHHEGGTVTGVTLDTGEVVEVGTLWWSPTDVVNPLTQQVIDTFGLAVDDRGFIKVEPNTHATSHKGLWAVGDVLGWAMALGAAYASGLAAIAILRQWFGGHSS